VAEGYAPQTGQVERTVEASHLVTPGHHIRCYPAKATDRYLLLPKRGVEFLDLTGNNHMRHNWFRGPCGHGVVPANGLLYVPPHQCFCYPGVKLTGFNALTAEIAEDARRAQPEVDRLERGPAYNQIINHQSPIFNLQSSIINHRSHAWPTYRHDARRSGAIDTAVPAGLDRLWEIDFGGRITPPVAAAGRLFVAAEDAHTVHCRDATSGEALWSYTAGGRIDSPPTLHDGLVLAGCTDGWVYCLRAADGELAWRRQAAPEDRRVVAFGQLESAWPVHGSVLVQDGVAYFTAGRSSYLDGGIYVFGVEPKTGEVLYETRLWSGRPDVSQDAGRPFDMEGTRTDVLASDGTDLYMFHTRLNPDLTRHQTPRITKLGDRQVELHLMSNDGFLDKTWFDRSFWTYSRRWPGYYFAYNAPKSGQILVFDETTTYGVHVFTRRRGHSPVFDPGTEGCELFADHNTAEPVLRPDSMGREKGPGYSRSRLPKWSVQVPVRVQAMVLTGERLFMAGPPDVAPRDDPLAAFEGRLGARLWVVAASDGRKLAEYELDRVPAFDGMIAAGGRLYLATSDGHVMCMGGQ
jgi:outer membrane protein assembly factor BamB